MVRECVSINIYSILKRMPSHIHFDEKKTISLKRKQKHIKQATRETKQNARIRKKETFYLEKKNLFCALKDPSIDFCMVKCIPYVIWNRIVSHSVFVFMTTILEMIFVPFLFSINVCMRAFVCERTHCLQYANGQ